MKVTTVTEVAATLLAAVFAIAGLAGASEDPPTYELEVSLNVPQAKLTGTARLDVPPGVELTIYRGDLHILSLASGSRQIAVGTQASDPLTFQSEGAVQIRFEKSFTDSDGDVIESDKIVLRDNWYPVVEGTYRYHLTATLPRDFMAFSEADQVHRTQAGEQATYVFDLPYPQREWDGITFIASKRWMSRTARFRDVDLSVHLRRRNAGQLEEMMQQAQHYLEQREALLGPYPFKRLAIVENPFPISYSLSMPTYVLLSQKSVASQVREDSALNHEITHEWFGDAVLADYDGGNWAEGVTSYFSDHLEGEALGISWERRQRMMAGYQGNVSQEAASPLSDFTESGDRASRVIGYAKSAIVFHMLRRAVGDEQFFRIMRDFVKQNLFQVVSWSDIREAFERATATDLRWFFHQWVEAATIPELGLTQVSETPAGNQHELRFGVTQKPPAMSFTVPLSIYFEGGSSQTAMLKILGERQEFRYLLDQKPIRVVLDENYDVFRRLTPAEIPPIVNTLLTRPRVVVFGTPAEQEKFGKLIEAFERGGTPIELHEWRFGGAPKARPAAAARRPGGTRARGERTWRRTGSSSEAETRGASLVLLGENNWLIAALFGRVDLPRAGFTITVLKHPRSPGNVVAILTATSKAEVDAAYGELIDRPRYSLAAFNGGKLTSYEFRTGERGIVREIAAQHP